MARASIHCLYYAVIVNSLDVHSCQCVLLSGLVPGIYFSSHQTRTQFSITESVVGPSPRNVAVFDLCIRGRGKGKFLEM